MYVPARWFFCAPDAPDFPSPHGCEASPWLRSYETNAEWGEVTGSYAGWDNGANPGYLGQCIVGDPQWFVDGALPSGILAEAGDLPSCCIAGQHTGELVLTGNPSEHHGQGPVGQGQLILRRPAYFNQVQRLVLLEFNLQYGQGSYSPPPPPPPPYPSPSYYGFPIERGCDNCPDGAAVTYSFDAGAVLVGTLPECPLMGGMQEVTYVSACTWQGPPIGAFGWFWILTISAGGVVELRCAGPGAVYQVTAPSWDCRSPLTLPLIGPSVTCNFTASTITIFPV